MKGRTHYPKGSMGARGGTTRGPMKAPGKVGRLIGTKSSTRLPVRQGGCPPGKQIRFP